MNNIYSIKKIASELNSIDDSDMVKFAGIVGKIKNWYKQINDPEYKSKVEILKLKSESIRLNLNKLNGLFEKFDESLKDKDVDNFLSVSEEIKYSVLSLIDMINVIQQQLGDSYVEDKEFAVSKYEKKQPAPSTSVHISTKVAPDFIKSISKELISNGYDKDSIKKCISSPEFINEVKLGILNGEVIHSEDVMESGREGEVYKTILTKPINIKEFDFSIQFYAYVVDLSEKMDDSKNRLSLRYIDNIKLYKKANIRYDILKTAGEIAAVEGLSSKSKEFINELVAVGNRLGINPSWLAAVMAAESGINSSALNTKGNAAGLIQFMPSTLKNYGISTDELLAMSDVEQLKYVERFYKPYAGRIKSPGDLYMATFLPIFVGKPEDTIVAKKDSQKKITSNLTYGKVYEFNSGLDSNKDGIIRISDITSRVNAKLNAAKKIEPIKVDGDASIGSQTSETGGSKPSTEGNINFDSLNRTLSKEYDDPGFFQGILNKVTDFFKGASITSNDIESIVKKAVYKQTLPTSYIKTKISGADYDSLISYAYILAEAADQSLLSDSEIFGNGEYVEIVTSISGTKEKTAGAMLGVSNIISDIFNDNYNLKIKNKLSHSDKSTLTKMSSRDIESYKRRFILKNIKV